ncbi:helix-turn-helix and ligand-binding sensor domain-containing protein [Planktosalinus lacus]|uniref:HTH luxR-type domain-containing protein n=1 Tax=Planktosalinus lacus TaxID=1526573 RepID=A0A8J2VAL9_9FLAO|nr:triple tyrosine motif-containing protein [Planktosalinus lacus]GGD95402.1 hypothetical protein GCM10011312_18850 [Planktosalinus lacus]
MLVNNSGVFSQELPPVINFSPQDYQAENQNWSISQGLNSHIYVANSKGLLEFNGDSWNLHPSPNESIIRSVFAFEDKIFTGSYRDFGFWKQKDTGELIYTSLSSSLNLDLGEDEQFWNILNYSNWLLFQSLNSIYIYNTSDNTIEKIEADEGITKIFKIKNDVYLSKPQTGIFKLFNGKPHLVSDHPVFKENLIVNLYETDEKILVQTNSDGIYSLEENPQPFGGSQEGFIKSLNVYSSIQSKNGDLVLGTISQGVVFIDLNGKVKIQITKEQTLSNNTVLSIFEDNSGNIWLGLDNGINCININSPVRIFTDESGELGTVYTSAIFEEKLYLGTNQGLFYKSLQDKESSTFKLVEGSIGQVWSLFVYDNKLFCGHNDGSFIVENFNWKQISTVSGTWCFKNIENNPDLLLQGNYEGISILEKTNGNWQLRNTLPGFNLSSKYIEFLNSKNILIDHEYKGVFKLTFDDNYEKVAKVEQDTTIEKGLHSSIVKSNEDIFYSYEKGIWKYNFENKIFKRDSTLSQLFESSGYSSGKLITTNNGMGLWSFTERSINYMSPAKLNSSLEVISIPISNSTRNAMVGYENILEVDNDIFLFGNAQGYMLLDLKKFKARHKEPLLSINEITAQSINNSPQHLSLTSPASLENQSNNIYFNFSISEFEKLFTSEYQYKLNGLIDEWSPWQQSNEVYFNNLPFGDYEFLVRGRIGDDNLTNTASFSFTIKRPFLLSNAMLLFYCILLIMTIILVHNIYKAYFKKQKRKLELKNQREMALKESENKSILMRLKNEQLKQDIDSKNRELAVSTMSLIKKNEFLNSIKSELLVHSNDNKDIKKVIKIIDKNLDSNDDWKFFEEAFNNADKDFFRKIKAKHLTLTPDDLRLCAYLRLNLSSKEIAPLFNISSKSVEVKRYRLRKKMDLPGDTNLTNYILEI